MLAADMLLEKQARKEKLLREQERRKRLGQGGITGGLKNLILIPVFVPQRLPINLFLSSGLYVCTKKVFQQSKVHFWHDDWIKLI